MSLEQHNIDQGYKARLADLEVTPPAHAWAAIAARLPNEKAEEKGAWWWGSGAATTALAPEEKSKRERVVFWWWTGALIALATLSLLAYYGMGANNPSKLPTPNTNTSAAALLPIAATQSNSQSQELNLTRLETVEDCPDVEEKKALATAKPIQAEGSTSIQLSPSKTIPAAALTTSIASTLEVRSTPAPSQLRSVAQVTSTLPASQATESPLPTDTKTTRGSSAVNPVGLSIASASMNELALSDLALLQIKAPKLPFGPGIGCEDFKSRAAWSFAVRLFGGPGMVFQKYQSTPLTADYARLRDSIETKQLSVHGGLRFEATNDLGLFVRAGADYQMYRLNNQFLGPRSSRTVIDSVFMEDTQTWRIERSNVSVQEQQTVYNRQHAVVFTGGVGFRKTFGNVSPYLMAEAGYEILFKRKGLLVLPNETVADLAEDDQGLYINDRPGFQYGGVIGVDFALTDRIELGLSGHYKQLGGIRGSADLLDYNQSTAFGALNLRYTIR